jgi:hypothetical protein
MTGTNKSAPYNIHFFVHLSDYLSVFCRLNLHVNRLLFSSSFLVVPFSLYLFGKSKLVLHYAVHIMSDHGNAGIEQETILTEPI